MDINLSVINIGGMIIKAMEALPVVKYDDLKDKVLINAGDKAKPVFLNALSFLFLLGKVKYNENSDTLELIRQ